MTEKTAQKPKQDRKPRRIGHVGQAYLEAVEKKKQAQAKTAVAAIARMKVAA